MKPKLFNKKVPAKVPKRKANFDFLKKVFTNPKVYIPKKLENGKKVPNIDKHWYVYYYFRNPNTGNLDKFIEKQGINRIKTVSERKKFANALKKALLKFLQEGNSPFKTKKAKIENKSLSVEEALTIALKEKKKVWSESSIDAYTSIFNIFLSWLKEKKIDEKPIEKLTKRHVVMFLNELTNKNGRAIKNTTRNGYRRVISSLLGKLVNDDVIKINVVSSIEILKTKSHKNTPFTHFQLQEIKKYCLENDSYLHLFFQFVIYAFLREIEICRIRVRDIDLENKIIKVKSKTEQVSTVLIIEPLLIILKTMDLPNQNPEHFLFTKNLCIGAWETKKEASKVRFFQKRFRNLREKIGDKIQLTPNQGIYSARHTSALDLFNSFKKQGLTDLEAKYKLMEITRHKSISGLENYLRDIGASLPKDYSDRYTLDF